MRPEFCDLSRVIYLHDCIKSEFLRYMRKTNDLFLTLLLVALILLPWTGLNAQQTLTVMDGDYHNQYVPVDGYNCDGGVQHNQFLLLAGEISAMEGSNISGLKFYFDRTGHSWSDVNNIPNVTFKLAEVENASLSSQVAVDDSFVQVYDGPVNFDFSAKEWNITFDEPYSYNGGNLLIDIRASTGAYVKKSGSNYMRYYTTYISGRAMKGTAPYDYCPKMTFTYEEGTSSCPKPKNITPLAVSDNAASFSWTAGGEETSWQYICLPADADVDWSSAAVQTANTTPTASVSGLDPETDYKFYVRAGCGSEQSASLSFKTKCPAIPESDLPYQNNFDSETTNGLPSCWDRISTTEYPKVTSGTAAYSGKCLTFYGTETEIAVLPAFATPIKDLALSFKYKVNSSTSYGKLHVGYLKADGTTFVELAELPQTAGDYKDYELALTDENDEAAYIALKYVGGTSNYTGLYVDNLSVMKAPSCFKPASLAEAADITSDGATFTWTASAKANETQYQYICVPSGETPDWDEAQTTDSRSVTLTGLAPVTQYNFYVRSYCADDDQSAALDRTFTTACGAISDSQLPWNYGFEDGAWGHLPACWGSLAYGDYGAYVYTTGAHTGGKCLYVMAGKTDVTATTVVLPHFNMPLDKLAISFYYKGTNNSTLQVGYLTNPDDKSSFVAVGEPLAVSTAYKHAIVPFAAVTAEGNIAVRYRGATSDGTLYIDDIRVARTELFTDGDDDFETRLADLIGEQMDVLLTRPMQFDGFYNTLCLPFSLTAEQLANNDCPLNNCTVKYFDYVKVVNGEMVIAIAPTRDIRAGVPYFVMHNGATESKPLFFRDVTVSAAEPASKSSDGLNFIGVFNNVSLEAQTESDHDIIYLGRENKLYWPNAANTVKGFRAYFKADTSNPRFVRGMTLRLEEGHNTPTAIDSTPVSQSFNPDVFKSIENGVLYIIRDGKRYSLFGHRME